MPADPMATPLTRMLGCRLPVIQPAMGWIAEPPLVAASVEAGAFGFLGAAVMTPQEAEAKIGDLRARTDKKFGVNFHMFQPGAAALVDVIIANKDRVAAVSFGRGPDAKVIARFKDAGILSVPTVGALKHARKMVELGVDMIVVQGGEGGGHTGSVATTVLLPQVLDAVRVPVVAAGGFADGRGLAAALAYGAAGVAMGTRFLMTKESPAPEAVKRRYAGVDVQDIVLTDRVDGLPQRMIRNAAVQRFLNGGPVGALVGAIDGARITRKRTGATLGELIGAARGMQSHGGLSFLQAMRAAVAPSLIQRAVVDGDTDGGLMASGQVAGRLTDIPSVADLLAAIERDARARIAALGGSVQQGVAA